jgi:predicted DNA-binding transcriptional regulator YafY
MAALPAPHRVDADLASRRIIIDPVRWRATHQRRTADLSVLQQAVFTDRRLTVRYRNNDDGESRTYTLDPYGLVNKAGVWYLVADHRRQPKLFRTDRIDTATVAEEPVQRRAGLELAEVWDSLRRRIDDIPTPIAVTVSVRRDRLGVFVRVHGADLADHPADPPSDRPPAEPATDPASERVEVHLRFRSLGAAEALLAFGTDAEVLTPAELRHALARRAAEAAATYAATTPVAPRQHGTSAPFQVDRCEPRR